MTPFVKWSDYCWLLYFFSSCRVQLTYFTLKLFSSLHKPYRYHFIQKNFISSINAIFKFHFLHFRAVWTSLLLWKVLWKNGTMERLIVPVKASTHKEVKWGLEPSAWTMSSGCFLILFIQGGLDEMTRQSLDSDCS